MSRMLSKMNLISVVQQLPKEDIETIQGYVEMIEQENNVQKAMIENFVKENQELKKQLEEYKQEKQEWINLLDMFKNQQKEFIDDLTSNINLMKKEPMMFQASCIQCKLLEETLLKYKEITGHQDGQQSGQV